MTFIIKIPYERIPSIFFSPFLTRILKKIVLVIRLKE